MIRAYKVACRLLVDDADNNNTSIAAVVAASRFEYIQKQKMYMVHWNIRTIFFVWRQPQIWYAVEESTRIFGYSINMIIFMGNECTHVLTLGHIPGWTNGCSTRLLWSPPYIKNITHPVVSFL